MRSRVCRPSLVPPEAVAQIRIGAGRIDRQVRL
jgi:hypothetical protein